MEDYSSNITYLKKKLDQKRGIVAKKYRYYEQKQKLKDFGISTPPKLRYEQSAVGWCTKSVDMLSDRLVFEGFANDTAGLVEIFRDNNQATLTDSAMLGAMISGCSFIYIYRDEDKNVKMQVLDGSRATGIIDESTGLLTEGYAVLEVDKNKRPLVTAYFNREYTLLYMGDEVEEIENKSGQCQLVPILFRPDAVQPFGRSRISTSSIDYVNSAMRTLKRAEISAEFYSYPQKYATGLSEDAEVIDSWKATMSTMMTFTKDEDGDKPTVGQFAQQSMSPHLEQLRSQASMFAGEVGLTAQDLGFESGNPASSDAIKSAHESLRATGRKAQKKFAEGFLNAGYVAKCVQDQEAYTKNILGEVKCVWKPLFEPDSSALSGIGDFLIKLNTINPDYIDEEMIKELIGF